MDVIRCRRELFSAEFYLRLSIEVNTESFLRLDLAGS
jgi:hypothetical protein